MKTELDNKLCADFPKLFSSRHEGPTESLMYFGFEHGDGWYEIVREWAAKIEAINDKLENPDDWILASQIKEKYGTLRLYVSSYPSDFGDEVDAAERDAEAKSAVTCEVCGAPGETKGRGWLRTVCVAHERQD